MTETEAKDVVTDFLWDAKRKMFDQYQHALRRISWLPWWKCWRAQQIADEALGWGLYWSKGFTNGQDVSPKTLPAYYRQMFIRWIKDRLGIRY